METLRICFSNIKFSNTLLETLKVLQIFLRTVLPQFQQQIFNWKYLQKFNWKYWENIFANTVESISTAAAIQYISPLCASATDKYGDKYVDSTASITRPFILYSSFDFNETNTTIDFCDVCKIWIIPQISMLPILFLYWLQKNYISFSILIKQCFMFVFFLKWWD